MKGVILTAGKAKRLRPATIAVGKVCLPIYDKPMIFYPLSLLLELGIDDICIICSSKDKPIFENMLKPFKNVANLNIKLIEENRTLGTAFAFNSASDFCKNDDSILIFGDNLLVDTNLTLKLKKAKKELKGATIFGKEVENPSSFGVIEKDNSNKLISIEEKPLHPKSNLVLTGLMMFDNTAFDKIKNIKPSIRGEYEITDLINMYIKENTASAEELNSNCIWLDTGTHDSMLKASQIIRDYQKENGIYGSLEVALYRSNKINKQQFNKLISIYNTEYQEKLIETLEEDEKQV